MEPLVLLGAAAGAVGLFEVSRWWRGRRPLTRLARRFSLTGTGPDQLEGVHDGHPVRIDARRAESGAARTRMTVDTLLSGISICAHGSASLGVAGPVVETGDAAFDGQVRVCGDPVRALALLDARTRDVIAGAVVTGLQLRDGALRWMSAGAPDVAQVSSVLAIAAQTADRLNRPGGVGALVEIALTDRLEVALHLFNAMPAGADQAALDDAVARQAVDRRGVVAAQRLGAEAVARLALDAGKADANRAEALAWLGKHARRRAQTVSQRCLDQSTRGCPQMSRAALRLIGDAQPVSLAALTQMALTDREMLPRVLRLAVLHGADAEALLLNHLGDVDPEIAHLAADGLGQVGTVAAVAALKLRGRFHLSAPRVRQAATEAIDAIHARLAPPGGLSMLEEGAGQVSFTPKAGALSDVEADEQAAD